MKGYRIITTVVLLTIALFALTACGRNRPDMYDADNYAVTDDSTHTLTVFTSDALTWGGYRFILHEAEALMAAEWAERGKNFSIDITCYTPRGRESALQRLHIEIMAGQVPDIII